MASRSKANPRYSNGTLRRKYRERFRARGDGCAICGAHLLERETQKNEFGKYERIKFMDADPARRTTAKRLRLYPDSYAERLNLQCQSCGCNFDIDIPTGQRCNSPRH